MSLLLHLFCPLSICVWYAVLGPILRLDRLVPCPFLLDTLYRRYLHARCPTTHHPCRYDPLRASHTCRIPCAPLLRLNWPSDDHHPARRCREGTIENEDPPPRRRVGRAVVLEPGLLCLRHGWDMVGPPRRCLGCDNNHFMHGVLLCSYTVGAI